MYEMSEILARKYDLSSLGVADLMLIENSRRDVSIEELETVACENKLNEVIIDFFDLSESIIADEIDEISELSWAKNNKVSKQHVLDVMVLQLEDLVEQMKKPDFYSYIKTI